MAQRFLALGKHGDWSLNPQNPSKFRVGMVANLQFQLQKVETGALKQGG